MAFLLKLNVCSALYGFVFFILTILLIRSYSIQTLSGLTFHTLEILFTGLLLLGVVIFAILIYKLTALFLLGRKASLWSIVFWLPYWLIFTFSFAYLFPVHNHYDQNNLGTGLILFFFLMGYPIYICFATLAGLNIKWIDENNI